MSQEMTEQEACGESSASDQWKTDWLARGVRVHRTAIVDKGARIGQGTTVWHHAHIRSTACIGETCVISKGVYIDAQVRIGNSCKIANGVQVYHGVVLGDGVFVGPNATFVNDRWPKAAQDDGSLVEFTEVEQTHIGDRVSIGAGCVIMPVKIGRDTMIAADTTVTKDVPEGVLLRCIHTYEQTVKSKSRLSPDKG